MTTQRHITSLWQRLYALCSLSVLFFGALSIAPAAAHAANLTTGASSKPSIGATSNAHNTFSAPVASKSLSTNVIRPAIAWTVSLTASSNDLWPGQSSTLTATANQNVGPTPYYIEIYNLDTGTRLTECPTGTTCSVTTALNGTNHFAAFISSLSTSLPPLNTQATSNELTSYLRIIP